MDAEHGRLGKCLFLMIQPQPLFRLFSSFQTHITILTTNKCEKCPSGIRCWNLNSRPSEHESPPETTIPGLQPLDKDFPH